MALEVYVGPLTIYYEGSWKQSNVPAAPPPADTITIVHIELSKDRSTDRKRRREEIAHWRRRLSDLLGSKIPEALNWDETSETYAAARPDHDGLCSLKLWAAYACQPDLSPPMSWTNLDDDPAYRRSLKEGASMGFPQITKPVEFWLPSLFDFTFEAEDPEGRTVVFGSAMGLLGQLEQLNEKTWKAGEATIEQWNEAGPRGGEPLEQAARYGFSEMLLAAQYACDKRMPMKLDG